MAPRTFVPLPAWIITHEQAIQAAHELERRETAAARRAKREKRKAKAEQLRRERDAARLKDHLADGDFQTPRLAPHEELNRLDRLEFVRQAEEEERRNPIAASVPSADNQEEGLQQLSRQNPSAAQFPGQGDDSVRGALMAPILGPSWL